MYCPNLTGIDEMTLFPGAATDIYSPLDEKEVILSLASLAATPITPV
jgi:hypothetical protein